MSKIFRKIFRNSSTIFAFLILLSTGDLKAQVALNANPLDPFPPSVTAIQELAKSNPSIAAAIEAFTAGNVPKLREALDAAKKENADLPATDLMLARLLMANSQWGEASGVLENYVSENPKDLECYKNFAEIAMVSGRWTDAWLQLDKASELFKTSTLLEARKKALSQELIQLRGEVAEQRRDIPTATALFEELSKLQPQRGFAFWALGRMKVAAGDIDAGIALLKKAKQLDPSMPQPELAVATTLAARGEKEKAETWFRSGLADKATSSETNWLQYLQFLIDDGRVPLAKVLIEKAPADYKAKREFKLAKAVILRNLNELTEAELLLSELHRANPNDIDAADHLALVLVESEDEGKRARAQQISESNLRQAPNAERIAATAAWIKFKTGSPDVADKILSQMLRGGRVSSQTAYYTAMLLKSLGRENEAVQFLAMAVNAPGHFPQKLEAKKELEAAQKAASESK